MTKRKSLPGKLVLIKKTEKTKRVKTIKISEIDKQKISILKKSIEIGIEEMDDYTNLSETMYQNEINDLNWKLSKKGAKIRLIQEKYEIPKVAQYRNSELYDIDEQLKKLKETNKMPEGIYNYEYDFVCKKCGRKFKYHKLRGCLKCGSFGIKLENG